MPEEGYVKVRTTAARGAYPVKNAIVTVLIEGENISDVTDESGNTGRLSVKAPPASLSKSLGQERPYAIYDVRIDAEGYIPLIIRGIPVFEDQTSIVQAALVPLFAAGGRTEPIVRELRPDFAL